MAGAFSVGRRRELMKRRSRERPGSICAMQYVRWWFGLASVEYGLAADAECWPSTPGPPERWRGSGQPI